MSVDTTNPEEAGNYHHKKAKEQLERSKEEGKRKRYDVQSSQSVEDSPRKKHRSKQQHEVLTAATQPSSHADSPDLSPFRQQIFSLYLPLSPICQLYSLQGLCAEHLSPLILTYYPPLQGVILSYHNPRLSEEPGRHDIEKSDNVVLARSVNEYAVSFVWLTVDFLIFKPQRGGWIEGWINLQNESHLGLVCWNLFNASIERKRLPADWKWVASGNEKDSKTKSKAILKFSQEDLSSQGAEEPVEDVTNSNETQEDEGYFEDSQGNRLEGSMRFKVKDLDASMSTDREKSYLSIEGTLLGTEAEEALVRQELAVAQGGGKGPLSRQGRIDYTMSGALENAFDAENGVQPLKHRIAY